MKISTDKIIKDIRKKFGSDSIMKLGDKLDVGVKKDIITKAGNTYTYGDIKLGVGVNKVKEFLKNNKETLDKIIKQLKEVN